jgi:multiple sugar transport system ATP-binding protein
VAPASVARYAGARSADGRGVVVGIRAEDVHPPASRPDLPTIEGRVELVEALGSGLMVYLWVDAEPVRPAGVDEDVAEEPDEGVARPNLIAHFPPRLDVRLGDTIPIAVDTAGLHFFDRESGAALR